MLVLPEPTQLERQRHTLRLELRVPGDLPQFAGHFDALPVVPGVALIGWALQLAASEFDTPLSPQRVERLRFERIAQPGDLLELALRQHGERVSFCFTLLDIETVCASADLVFAVR